MISKSDYLILVALTLAGIENRKATDSTENILRKKLVVCGVDEEDARTWAGELIYNEGDNPTAAVDRILNVLGLTASLEEPKDTPNTSGHGSDGECQ